MKLIRLNDETYVDAEQITAVELSSGDFDNKTSKAGWRMTVEVGDTIFYCLHSKLTHEQAEGLMTQLVDKLNAQRSEPLTILGDSAIDARTISGAYMKLNGADTWRVLVTACDGRYIVRRNLPRAEAEKVLAQVVSKLSD